MRKTGDNPVKSSPPSFLPPSPYSSFSSYTRFSAFHLPLFLTLFIPSRFAFYNLLFPFSFPFLFSPFHFLLPPHLLFLLTSWTRPLSSSPPFLSSTMLLRTFKFSSTFCTLTPTYLPFSISCLHFPHFRILTLRFHIRIMSNINYALQWLLFTHDEFIMDRMFSCMKGT